MTRLQSIRALACAFSLSLTPLLSNTALAADGAVLPGSHELALNDSQTTQFSSEMANGCTTASQCLSQDVGESRDFSYSGFASYTYFKNVGNKTPFPTTELGLSAQYGLNQHVTAFASVRYEDDTIGTDMGVTSAFVNYANSHAGFDFDVTAGRIPNAYAAYNYYRLNPMSRGSIILPQAIYWNVLDELAGYSDGVGYSVRYRPWGLELNQSSTRYHLTESIHMNETLFIPGNLTGGNTRRTSLIWRSEYGFHAGIQHIDWDMHSDLVGNTEIHVKNANVGYRCSLFGVSYERANQHNTMSDLVGAPPATLYSATARVFVSDTTAIKFNRNYVNYNTDLVNIYNPYKREATDNNVGVSYHDLGSRWTFRGEYHKVSGTSWLSSVDNPTGFVKDWELYAIQAVYEF